LRTFGNWLNYRTFAVVRVHKCLLNARLVMSYIAFHSISTAPNTCKFILMERCLRTDQYPNTFFIAFHSIGYQFLSTCQQLHSQFWKWSILDIIKPWLKVSMCWIVQNICSLKAKLFYQIKVNWTIISK